MIAELPFDLAAPQTVPGPSQIAQRKPIEMKVGLLAVATADSAAPVDTGAGPAPMENWAANLAAAMIVAAVSAAGSKK